MTRFSSTDHAAMAVALSDLPFGEQLLLWGIRMWVRSYNEGANIHNILHNGFKLAGVPTALKEHKVYRATTRENVIARLS